MTPDSAALHPGYAGLTNATRDGDGWNVEGLGRTRYLVGADGAKSRVAQRAGLGRVRDFLYGIEYEFAGAALQEPDALHCFLSKRYAPGYIGWVAQNPTGVQAGLAFQHRATHGVPDIEGFLDRVRDLARDAKPTAPLRWAAEQVYFHKRGQRA